MNTRDRLSFKHIFARLPWLKIVVVVIAVILAILDLSNVTISKVQDKISVVEVAPMAHHVRVREIEGKKLVALTFDDGPSSATTPALLDLLKQKNAHATFFMLGNRASGNPDLVKRAEKEGHVVASHTMYHQNFATISRSAIESDLAESRAVFNDILGHNPALVRPPYGNTTDVVRDNSSAPIILWSVDTLDWKNKDVGSILTVAKEQVHDGAIILMHDIYETSVEAAGNLIDTLRADGYELVTVSELADLRGVSMKDGAIYYNFRP